jgi:hypothetical protein
MIDLLEVLMSVCGRKLAGRFERELNVRLGMLNGPVAEVNGARVFSNPPTSWRHKTNSQKLQFSNMWLWRAKRGTF